MRGSSPEHKHKSRFRATNAGLGLGCDEVTKSVGSWSPTSVPPTIDTILLLEKVVQDQEQSWIENLNILEHLIVNITENYLNANPDLAWKCNFVVRRLPTYLASSTNTNEYAIVLEDFSFSLTPPPNVRAGAGASFGTASSSAYSKSSRTGSSLSSSSFRTGSGRTGTGHQVGQLEIFPCESGGSGKYGSSTSGSNSITRNTTGNDLLSQFVSEETRAFYSQKVFKEFARSFLDGFNKELARNSSTIAPPSEAPSKLQVQLLGPQLLANMVHNPSIDKIFKLVQSKIPTIRRHKVGKCSMSIDHAKSVITLVLDETRVAVRPALYYNMAAAADAAQAGPATRLSKAIIERLPLHHPLFLNITQALTKGQLLFPTNCETLWTLSFWPNEAHILANFHPSSVPSRILKMFSLFCLQPQMFLEFASSRRTNSLLILNRDPDEDEEYGENGPGDFDDDDEDGEAIRLDSFTHKNKNENDGSEPEIEPEQLTIDFLVHCFITELETAPRIEDWSPSGFPKRLHSLLGTALDATEKCFYPNYFIRTNLLKGYGKAAETGTAPRPRSSTDTDQKRVSANIQDFIDDMGFGEEGEDAYGGRGDEEDEDTFTLGEIDLRHYAEIQEDDIDKHAEATQRDVDFGIAFEELKIDESGSRAAGASTSASNFHVVNPFATFQATEGAKSKNEGSQDSNATKKGFGSLLKRLSNTLAKRPSVDETEETVALEGFEESINQARREQTMGARLPPASTPPESQPKFKSTKSLATYVNRGFEPAPEPVASAEAPNLCASASVSHKESIFKIILERLCTNELFYAVVTPPRRTPSWQATDVDEEQEHERAALMIHMEQARKTLYAQDELVNTWRKTVSDLVRPKYVCPHTFMPRQIQYVGLLVSWVIKCTGAAGVGAPLSASGYCAATTTWEISGDILRTVLYQMRSEPSTMLHKQKAVRLQHGAGAKNGFHSKSFNVGGGVVVEESTPKASSMLARTLSSFVPQLHHNRGSYDICRTHHHHLLDSPESSVVNDEFETTTFGMDNPELATTHRLLQWLWQLRNSKIGRLSGRAGKYIELLHESSLVNSFFLEQWSSANIMQALALKSAQAVTQIMSNNSGVGAVPAHVPLVAAWKRGWLWAEMVLSLVAWNGEKGIDLRAQVPVFRQDDEGVDYVHEYKEQTVQLAYDPTLDSEPEPGRTSPFPFTGTTPSIKHLHSMSIEPDDNAITLAFHSEPATPIGWNDFEDPRRPGPWTVPVLILSACGYYNQWEVVAGGGNIIQVMTRLQKFNSLQQVGALLAQPHKKTALNEIRKLSKSSSFRTFQFDGNVMTKTFRRLASLRNTARSRSQQRRQEKDAARAAVRAASCSRAAHKRESALSNGTGLHYVTCDRAGCPTSDQLPSSASIVGKTIVTFHNCTEIECTKL